MLNIKQELFYSFAILIALAFANLAQSFIDWGMDVNKAVFLMLAGLATTAAIAACFSGARMWHKVVGERKGIVSLSFAILAKACVAVWFKFTHVIWATRNQLIDIRIARIERIRRERYESFDRITRLAAKQFNDR